MKTSMYLILAGGLLLGVAVGSHAATVRFDGVDDYVRIEDSEQLDFTANYTLECWFRAESFGGLRGLISKYNSPAANGYLLRLNGDRLDFDGMVTVGLSLQAGRWYHVAAVNNNGTRQLFLNCVQQTLEGTAVAVKTNSDPLCLGRDYLTDEGRVLNGQLDEVRIWKRALSEVEVLENWNRRLTGTEADLVAYYKLDESTGTSIADATRNGNTGTLFSGVTWNTAEDAAGTALYVSNLNDSGAGSLRQTIAQAQPGSVILITNTGTITLSSGELAITKDVAIVGPGAAQLAISGNNKSRVFAIAKGASVLISSLTIRDGHAADGGAGGTGRPGGTGGNGQNGGGIYNAGILAVSACAIVNNRAGNGGNGGTGDAIEDHTWWGGNGGTGGYGGGIYIHDSGVLTLNRCTISGNCTGSGGAGGHGGNGATGGVFEIGDNGGSGGSGGQGGSGGGIYNGGVLTASLCTISGNLDAAGGAGGAGGNGWVGTGDDGSPGAGGNGAAGGSGGGIYNVKAMAVSSCTVAYNFTAGGGAAGAAGTAGEGGAAWGAAGGNGTGGGLASSSVLSLSGRVQVVNSIIALNGDPAMVPDDVAGAFNSRGYNLVGTTSGSSGFGVGGDLLNRAPLLSPLGDYGGPTWTHALWPESPAVNKGDNTAVAGMAVDQRGLPRIACAKVDIGAFEYAECAWLPHPAAGSALYFDGRDDYVQAGNTLNLSNCSFTIEAWARRDFLGTLDCIVSLEGSDLIFGFGRDNAFDFRLTGADLNTTPVLDTVWHHWAATYDTNGPVRLIYMDGTLVASNRTPARFTGSGRVRIGDAGTGGWAFDGEIDEVRIWKVARTATEIQENFARSLSGEQPNLIAHYRCDEAGGNVARDAVTDSAATLVNGAQFVTAGTPLYQPLVNTGSAEMVRATSAALLGEVNPGGPYTTAVWVEYGPSLYLGKRSSYVYLEPGLASKPVSFAVTELESGTRYYYRIAAANQAGTVYGKPQMFDTLVVGKGYPISTLANNGQSCFAPRHATDEEGNIYLAGLFTGSAQFNVNLHAEGSDTNAFLAKLARKGDWRWAVNIPVTNGQLQIKAVALEFETNVLVAGAFSGTASFGKYQLTATNGSQAFMARYMPSVGGWTWAVALGAGPTNTANALVVGDDGAIYVGGQFSGDTSFGTNSAQAEVRVSARGGSDGFIARFNASGAPEWATAMGGTQAVGHDGVAALAAGPFGEVYASGFFMDQGVFGMESVTSAGGSDVFLVALNAADGLVQRVVRAGGASNDTGTALILHPDGTLYLAAQCDGTANFNGAPLPGLDAGGMNLVVAQLERRFVLTRRSAARGAWGRSLAVSTSGRVYLAGDFSGVMRYGPELITVGSGATASSDVFLTELDEDTDALIWRDFKQLGGIGAETCGTVSVDLEGSVALSGTYGQSLHLGYVEMSTPNQQEIFLARIDSEGVYEHNLWEIGQPLVPPDQALAEPLEQNRAKGLPQIEILKAPTELQDSSDVNSFFWNDTEKRLYALRPVIARIKWPLTSNITNLANVATVVGRCVWPEHPNTNVAGVPVELQGPSVGRGLMVAEIAFNTNGASITPVTRSTDQFQIFQTATNASGYNVIRYWDGENRSAFDVVFTRPYGAWVPNQNAAVGQALGRTGHQDSTGRNGYVLFERSFYDAAAHDRASRTGPIIPVNRNLHSDPNRDMVVVWYRTNAVTGVAWGSDPVRYKVDWPVDAKRLVIASGLGEAADEASYPQAHVYQQPDANSPGFNPNEEHAFVLSGRLYALRCDLNELTKPKASEPYVILKYLGPNATNDWRTRILQVVAEDGQYKFATFGAGQAGLEVQLPECLNLLSLCAASNRIAFGHSSAHQAWNGKIFAKSAGYFQVQYWYPTMPDFYFGPSNPPVGSCVPWMSHYAQEAVFPGTNHVIGQPVLVGYQISWPDNPPELASVETLTTSKGGMPDLLNFASARVIYDEGNPNGANHLDSLVRIFDPLSERTIQLPWDFKLPDSIKTADDRGRSVFPGLPYPLRIRLFYDELNQRLSFGGWYDEHFGTGEPLLLPNILSPRECARIKALDGTNVVSAFDEQIDRLYALTRNPNQVDVDGDGLPDTELRAGLITQIRESYNEILVGPVLPGPTNTFITWRTNVVGQRVDRPVTNVIQEQFGPLPKALTAGLRPGAGFITVVENDDALLKGQPINLYVILVTNRLYRGDLKVLPSDNVFDERLALRHSGDFAGEPQNFEFEWYYQPDVNGASPPFPVVEPGQTNWNGWIRFPTYPVDAPNGCNDITLGEGNNLSSLLVLSDNWLLCRYRGFTNGSPTEWSDWVGAPGGQGAMLAEGWIKRVLAGLNEFDSRVKDFHQAPAATYASMVLQAGERYEGPIAFNPSPNYLNSLGLIESYETVLERGRKLSIDGLPAVNFGPANDALLRAAGKISDLYLLLGNEAYADASDPTIGFTTSSGEYGNLAPSIFCFQNQLDSPLEEELALLRGRDDSGMTVRARPIYNRLIWNFTQGEGEVAYQLTYNISDQNGDGFTDEKDARVLYPQGHGDAWGHYLTGIKKYYGLLRHPYYEWVPRPEAVIVAGSPVQVDYLDERKFAQAAAAKAKAGAEIVSLTYRQKYVADPAGQWQGYKDTDTDRAWGVSEWATRAGSGAYFDWVVANAILPATDPDKTHVGIQKIDRTTVTDLAEIPAQFSAIEAQLDTVDRGLNPLGLATGAMPFDIDPSRIDSGETHFDQMYSRALKSMGNALALFDHVNTLSQSLRKNQDQVDEFSVNVEEQERSYKNRMIELFGYPYAGDIGPAGTYPSGYDGPDIYHYMYVNASDLTGQEMEPTKLITGYYKPLAFPGATFGVALFPDDLKATAQPALDGDGTFHVSFPMVENGAYLFQAPGVWASRRAPGKIQNAISEMLKARAQLTQGIVSYHNLRKQIESEIDLLRERTDLAATKVIIRTRESAALLAINAYTLFFKKTEETAKAGEDKAKEAADAVKEGVPGMVGLANDVGAPARAVAKTAGNTIAWPLRALQLIAAGGEAEAENAKLVMESQTALGIDIATDHYEIAQQAKVIEQLCREELAKRVELHSLQEGAAQACGAYLSVLAEGQRLLEERYNFRVRTAAQVQEYRYQDMAFRIFQNDALQKYRAQFDLAARYVYLAAKAYDYETCLLNGDTGAGSRLLTDIVRQRTLGQLVNGLPISGRQGLADPLARLGQNFEVYRGQLGFTTPETETGRFSLRSELFRVRPGNLETNALNGLVSTNRDWRALLQQCRVPDLWQVPEFRRFCRPFAPESAGPQPGLVIRIPTTITFGLNYFGWPLGPGDSAYDSSRFATKVRSVGVWFSDYNLAGLSMTPRVYLVPVGTDVMRSPSSTTMETREFNVVDQKLPIPFPVGATDLRNPGWIPAVDSLSETFGDVRRFSSFRAYHDKGWFAEEEATRDSRLIGRSVWNTEWLLIIPGGTFLYDPDRGLDSFIASVEDIKIFFQTYSYSGN